jgi:ferredoxin-type protein NapH
MQRKYRLPLEVFIFIIIFLSIVQVKLENPIILLERFIIEGGWIEIIFIGLYGALIAWKIQDVNQSAKWRRISWTIFSVVFFSQLALGLMGFDRFLMTGELHLPIPVMIMSGPVFRGELSIMTFLFLSTLILTGPAWCSQLCYFGAIDNLSAQKNKPAKGRIKNRTALKFSFLFLIIVVTLLLRWFHVPLRISTIVAVLFGIGGILVIMTFSRKKGKMIHCLTWCPIGTIVNYGKYINPFRMYIDSSCTLCMKCTNYCKYDALNPEDIKSGKPAVTCTYCGDCLSACHANSIKYKFFRMKPDNARRLYLFLTVSFHAIFLALGRI